MDRMNECWIDVWMDGQKVGGKDKCLWNKVLDGRMDKRLVG